MTYAYVLGKTYSFNVYAPNVLGTDFQNVKLLAIMDADTATRSGLDIYSQHRKIYPYVPAEVGMPDDPTQYNYIQIITQAGNRTILGMPWIDESSIEVVTAQTIVATIGGVTASDMAIIRQALAQNGYNNVKLTLSN